MFDKKYFEFKKGNCRGGGRHEKQHCLKKDKCEKKYFKKSYLNKNVDERYSEFEKGNCYGGGRHETQHCFKI